MLKLQNNVLEEIKLEIEMCGFEFLIAAFAIQQKSFNAPGFAISKVILLPVGLPFENVEKRGQDIAEQLVASKLLKLQQILALAKCLGRSPYVAIYRANPLLKLKK